jgi:hypothetical protein
MKIKEADFECDLCKSEALENGFHGVTYAQTIGKIEDFVGSELVEYSISITRGPKADRQSRGHREVSRSKGKAVSQIRRRSLRDELVILPGAAMSAADVLQALRKYIEYVQEHGMWVGRYKDALIVESLDGSLRAE